MLLKMHTFWVTVAKIVFLFIFTPFVGMLTILPLIVGEPFINLMKSHGFSIVIIALLISIIIGLIYSINRHSKDNNNNNQGMNDTNKIYEALVAVLEKYSVDKDYATVIRLGSAISRVLWIAGQYKYRIQIGDIVFTAAAKLEDQHEMARVQIDDIGWTYLIIKEKKKSIENIQNGLQIALSNNEYYLVAKAHRHLAGIYILQGYECKQKIDEHFNAAKDAAANIPDATEKREMLAGIAYSYVEYIILQKKYDYALNESKKILDEYIELLDIDRKSKCLSQLGKIYFLLSEYPNAIASFNRGIGVAEMSSRHDELVKCLMGLAATCYKRGEIVKARTHKQTCEKYRQDENTFVSWDEINTVYNEITLT